MLVTITWNAGFGHQLTTAQAAQLRLEGLEPSVSQQFDLDLPPGEPRMALEAIFEATNLRRGPLWQAMTDRGLPERRDHTALSVGDTVTLAGTVWRCDPLGWSQVVAQVLRQPDADVAREVLELLRSGRAPGMVGVTSSQGMSAQSALVAMGGRSDLAGGIGSWTALRIEAWRDTEIDWLAECWTIAASMPRPYRAPAATVAALGEWVAGADPRPTLAWATEARAYQLATLLASAYEAGRSPEDMMAILGVVSPSAVRHGAAREAELARAGQALNAAGWSVNLDGQGVGYLNHGAVAVARYDTAAGVLRFPEGSRFEPEWDAALTDAGVDANTAIQALRRVTKDPANAPTMVNTQAARPVQGSPVQGVAGEHRQGPRRTGPTR